MRARLALEDGTVYRGTARGAHGEAFGEVVFNTAMSGYQEIITDPSYCGQIVAMTYPLIGNYGVNEEDNESERPALSGFIAREFSRMRSNWRSTGSLEEFLRERGVVAADGFDTRALTRRIRSQGAMRAVLSTLDDDDGTLVDKAKASTSLAGRDLVAGVTCGEPYMPEFQGEGPLVVAIDYGMKANIAKLLAESGFRVTIVPASTTADAILAMKPDGVFLSNGPGDPAALVYAYEAVRELLGRVPLFGICLGHQLLALALGIDTFKLKFGHHGANHPVKNLGSERIEITSQNHSFAVSAEGIESLRSNGRDVTVTHLNLNDGTIEGLSCPQSKAFSVQYHPEAAPGPHDSAYLFGEFRRLIEEAQ